MKGCFSNPPNITISEPFECQLDEETVGTLIINGAPERIRTSDLCLRRATLYPAELRAHL